MGHTAKAFAIDSRRDRDFSLHCSLPAVLGADPASYMQRVPGDTFLGGKIIGA
jgi:hypothetical protein